MAKKVSGITVEIGGDTTKLGKALAEVDGQSRSLQAELRGVESLLKFDPSNVELLRQKQEILNDSIDNTRKKLTVLKDTQEQVQAQFDRGDITAQQYRDFQREIVVTEQKLQGLETQLSGMDEAGAAIEEVAENVEELGDNSAGAGDGLEGVTSRLDAGLFMQAAEQLGAVSDKLLEIGENAKEAAFEMGQSQTDLQATLGLTSEETEALGDVVQNVFQEGVVGSVEEATTAVGAAKAAFGELNDADLETLTNKIIGVSTRTGTDVTENTRAAKRMMDEFGISGEEAMDLIAAGYQNNLNASGDFTDTLNEYSTHFANAGFSAEEMLQILNNGMENGSLNTDKAADAVKELQIRMGDGSFEKIIGNFSTGTQDMFTAWKNGEATVSDVATSISGDLSKMTPTEQQEALSLLSSQFEDLGIDGAAALFDVGDAFTDVSGKADEFTQKSPGEEWESSIRGMQEALIPIGEAIIQTMLPVLEALAKLSEWFANLPGPVVNFITIFGGLIAAFGALTPIIAAVIGIITVFGTATLLPIIGIVAAVSAAVAAIIVVFQNWGSISDWLTEKWGQFKEWIGELWTSLSESMATTFDATKQYLSDLWTGIQETLALFIENMKLAWEGVKLYFSELWLGIQEGAALAWQMIVDAVMLVLSPFIETFKTIWTGVSDHLGTLWTSIQTIATNAWEIIKAAILGPVLILIDLVTGDFDGMSSHLTQIWENVKAAASNIWTALKDAVGAIVGALVATLAVLWENLKNNATSIFNAVKDTATNIWNTLKSSVVNAANGLKDGAVNAWNTLKSSVINAANGLKDGAVNAWNNLNSSVTNLANSAKDGAINAWNSLKSMTSNIFNGVVSSIKSILKIDLFSVGRNIIDGLVNGIKSGVGAVGAAISEVAGNIKSKIKGALGINSPSRWMRDVVGKMIPQGIAVGVKADTSKALDAMDDLTAGVMDAGSPDMMKMMNGNSIVSQSAQMDALKSSLGASGTLAAKVDAMIGLLGTYLPNLNTEPKIVMDTGALVGEIKNEMNQVLGNDADLERRGR